MRVQPSKSRRLPPVVAPIERPRPAARRHRRGPRPGRRVRFGIHRALALEGDSPRDEFSRPRRAHPSDPFFFDQWGLKSIGVPTAWDVTLGDKSVIVAVVDTGVWWTQPDIQANMWTNSADGTHGYDFVDSDTNPMDIDPSGTYHGTGVAGVIGAITD